MSIKLTNDFVLIVRSLLPLCYFLEMVNISHYRPMLDLIDLFTSLSFTLDNNSLFNQWSLSGCLYLQSSYSSHWNFTGRPIDVFSYLNFLPVLHTSLCLKLLNLWHFFVCFLVVFRILFFLYHNFEFLKKVYRNCHLTFVVVLKTDLNSLWM